MASRVGWRFYDPVTEETYAWTVNPYEDAGSHTKTKSTAYEIEAGSHQGVLGDHRIDTLIFETNVEREPFKYNGRVYTEAEYAIMEEWCSKNYAVHIIDDLGREFRVWINGITWDRQRSRQSRYKHSYTLDGIILEEIF